ncbi:MAG: hypothetical protein DRN04_07900 [Thermoprotei archaeon]|nr:MAG: hypothetical protein DRN04_07900 [Thermoprotei archaeon]
MKKLKLLLSTVSAIIFFIVAAYLPYVLFTKNLKEIATLLQPLLNINTEEIPPITISVDRDLNLILAVGIIYTIVALTASIVCYFKEARESILEVAKATLMTLFKAVWLIGSSGVGVYVIKIPPTEIFESEIQLTLDMSIIAIVLLLLSLLEVAFSVLQIKKNNKTY